MGVGRTGFGWDADGGSVVGTGGGGRRRWTGRRQRRIKSAVG